MQIKMYPEGWSLVIGLGAGGGPRSCQDSEAKGQMGKGYALGHSDQGFKLGQ